MYMANHETNSITHDAFQNSITYIRTIDFSNPGISHLNNISPFCSTCFLIIHDTISSIPDVSIDLSIAARI